MTKQKESKIATIIEEEGFQVMPGVTLINDGIPLLIRYAEIGANLAVASDLGISEIILHATKIGDSEYMVTTYAKK